MGLIRDTTMTILYYKRKFGKSGFFFQLALVGSGIGGSIDMKEMLQFVSNHKETLPIVETMPMNEINNAIERVKAGNVRFRMIVEN